MSVSTSSVMNTAAEVYTATNPAQVKESASNKKEDVKAQLNEGYLTISAETNRSNALCTRNQREQRKSLHILLTK